MNRDEYIKLAYQEATGETGADLAESDEAWIILRDKGNTLIADWQNAVDAEKRPINWNSLWGRVTLVSTVSATDTFAIDTAVVRKLSTEEDGFKIKLPDGRYKVFTVVKPSQLSRGGDCVALVGDNVVFAEKFAIDDPFIGASILVSYFGYASLMTDASSKVPVDDPMWLVFRGGAQLATHDFIKSSKGPQLLNFADERMQSMIAANSEQDGNNYVDHDGWSPDRGMH